MLALSCTTSTYFHEGYEIMQSRGGYTRELQIGLQTAREAFNSRHELTLQYMAEVEANAKGLTDRVRVGGSESAGRKEGWLYMQRRSKSWFLLLSGQQS